MLVDDSKDAIMEEKNDNDSTTEFYMAVDDILSFVQGMSERIPRQQLSAAMLYAAARYNAYNWIFREGDEEQQSADASQWFANEYLNMFEENSESLLKSFKEQGVIK